MESSVKSLIQSEEQAKAIVMQAEKEKTDKLKEARTNADQLINRLRQEKETALKVETEKVSCLFAYSGLCRKTRRLLTWLTKMRRWSATNSRWLASLSKTKRLLLRCSLPKSPKFL